MSDGSPSRFIGSRSATSRPRSPSHRIRAKSVRISPGAMQLTRTRGPSSAASCLVMWIIAALVMSYTPSWTLVLKPPAELMLITEPPSASRIAFCHAFWVHTNGAVTLLSTVLRHLDRSQSIVGPA